MIIAKKEGWEILNEDNFYQLISPSGQTMVNASGTREELIIELKRWKREVDYNNLYMMSIEDHFINILEDIKQEVRK